MKQASIQLLIFLILIHFPMSAQSDCMSASPTLEEMDKAFLNSLKAKTDSQKIKIAFFPFQDGSLVNSDPTLSNLFPVLFYEMTSAENQALVFHPFITINQAHLKNLSNDDLFSDDKIASLAKEMGATHAVYGMFQKKQDAGLRYFIRIYQLDQKEKIKTLEFDAMQGDRLFGAFKESIETIFKEVGVKSKSNANNLFLKSPPTFESMRYFVKGMEMSMSYDETNLAISKVWFEKSATTTYAFKRAWLEKVRVLYMLSLVLKQRGMDYAILIGEATNALKEGGAPLGWEQRWITGNQAFMAGVSMFTSNAAAAVPLLKQAILTVPEDAIAHHYLAKAYSKTGNPDAAKEDAEAQKINPCLKSSPMAFNLTK